MLFFFTLQISRTFAFFSIHPLFRPKSKLLVLTALTLASCEKDNDSPDVDCTNFHWEYEGETGVDNWDICEQNASCGGDSQSPIDIVDANTTTDGGLAVLQTNYLESPIELENNGHAIEFVYETENSTSTLEVNGVVYKLLQFHFHTLSEHTLNGQHFPMEVHLVHQNSDTGELAVIGIFFEVGEENAFLKNLVDDIPTIANESFSSEEVVNAADLLPSSTTYYTYNGSLTTPPCSEIVNWFVLQETLQASQIQIDAFSSVIADNYRPTQPLNGREVKKSN